MPSIFFLILSFLQNITALTLNIQGNTAGISKSTHQVPEAQQQQALVAAEKVMGATVAYI